MKKLVLFTSMMGLAMLVRAQSAAFETFKFDIGVGYATPSQGSTVAGATFTLQPHYRVSDDFAVGLRIEAAAVFYHTAADDKRGSAIGSGCLTGEYYLSDQGFRPFIGAGVGLFDQSAVTVSKESGSDVALSARVINLGAFPEIGFEAGHFRFSLDYDYTGGYTNYFSAKIGAFFGGGKRNK